MTPVFLHEEPGLLRVTREGAAGIITLSDGARGNALGDEMVAALDRALDVLDTDPSETLVLQADGKGFCGGLDLSGLDRHSDASLMARLIRIELLLQRIAAFSKRTACFAHGFAFGAGADLLLACDLALATPDCRLSFPGRRFGLVLGTGRLGARLGSAAALEAVTAAGVLNASALPDTALSLCDREQWPARREEIGAPLGCDADTRALLLARARGRTCENADADLVALVRSVAKPGLHQRISDYAEAVRRPRAEQTTR